MTGANRRKGRMRTAEKSVFFRAGTDFPFKKRRHRRSRCIVDQSSMKTDKESYENPLYLW